MIILIKEPPTLGRPRFAKRLADHLDSPLPAWPITEETLSLWKESLSGWWEAGEGFFSEINYLDIDRLLAILMIRKADEYPPPPSGPDARRSDFERWRDRNAVKIMIDHMDELLAMIHDLVDANDFIIIDGHALGTSPRDTPLSLHLQARYSNRPILRILLKTPDGAAPNEDAPEHAAVVNRSTYGQDELLSMIRRADPGVELDEAIHSARTRIAAPQTL